MAAPRIAITVEFEQPGSHDLESCIRLVMNQMRAMPHWPSDDTAGTGLLNYVCHDKSMAVTKAEILRGG